MNVDTPEQATASSSVTTQPENVPAPKSAAANRPEPAVRRPSRLKDVSPRKLEGFKNFRELAWTMVGAIEAHRRLYEDAGTLHGDINMNTILILDWPEGSGHGGPKTEGALVDFDIPYTAEALRKRGMRWPPKMELHSRYWPVNRRGVYYWG